MDSKKRIILRFVILLLLAVTIISPAKPSFDFSKQIRNEKFDDVSLAIYYISPFILTIIPLSVDNLINSSDVNKIVINGSDLEEHFDLFKQISNDDLIPVMKKTYLNVRLYYVLESKKNGKLLDVAMWGGNNNSIFVNGFEFKGNDIFYNVIKPFLPEDAVNELEDYVAGIWPE